MVVFASKRSVGCLDAAIYSLSEHHTLIPSLRITCLISPDDLRSTSPWPSAIHESLARAAAMRAPADATVFPREIDLLRFSGACLNRIALRLNQRRERLWALKLLPIDCERCCIDRL